MHVALRRHEQNIDLCAGWQGNICSTWTPKAFSSPVGVSFQSLIRTAPAKVNSHRLRSGHLEQQPHTHSSTCLSRGLYLKPERNLAVLRASVSDVSSEGRSLDSDDDIDGGHSVQDSSSSVVEDSLSVSGDAPISQNVGKPGFVSFYNAGSGKEQPESTEYQELKPARSGRGSLLWLLGPLALVVSVVGPPLYLRRFFESILEDSLLTGELYLFYSVTCGPFHQVFMRLLGSVHWLINLVHWHFGKKYSRWRVEILEPLIDVYWIRKLFRGPFWFSSFIEDLTLIISSVICRFCDPFLYGGTVLCGCISVPVHFSPAADFASTVFVTIVRRQSLA